MKVSSQVALRSSTGGLVMPLFDGYDRELLFEYITNRVNHDRWVEVRIGREFWRARLLAPEENLCCTVCGDALTIAHASGLSHLCTRCRKRLLH